jgi:uncharacterized membrane protein
MELTGWTLLRFLHLLGAVVWVGGQLTLAVAVVPAFKAELDDQTRSRVGRSMARRYGVVAFAIGLPLQIATGIGLAYRYGVDLDGFDRDGYGAALGVKLVLVVAAVALAAWHGMASASGNRRLATLMSYTGMVAAVVILFLSAWLTG